jgi:predicted Fe-S protein YdhL (DUF1289 family)
MREIGGWAKLGREGRANVLELLPERMETLTKLGKLGPVPHE